MSRWFVLFMLLILSVGLSPLTAAQDDAGWPVIERCVGEPTAPPAGWTFEGTIFTQEPVYYLDDLGGLHAIRADVSTPYFVAFNGRDILVAGALSPDGRWFAVPAGQNKKFGQTPGWNSEAIHIYSTDPSRRMLTLESDVTHGYYGIDSWLDNEHFIYTGYDLLTSEFYAFKANPFTQVIEPFEYTAPQDDPQEALVNILQNVLGTSNKLGPLQISPDMKKVVLRVFLTTKLYSERFLFANVEEKFIADLCIASPENPESFIRGFAWSPNSSQVALSQDGWIRIFDTATWGLYNIFPHESYVIDWLEGWSRTD